MKEKLSLHLQGFVYMVYGLFGLILLWIAINLSDKNSIENLESENISTENSSTVAALSPSIDLGKKLFKKDCASCHAKNMKARSTGPALAGVMDRWNGNLENISAWIRNSAVYLETRDDDYARQLYLEYGKKPMTAFERYSDADIQAVLDYIEFISKP